MFGKKSLLMAVVATMAVPALALQLPAEPTQPTKELPTDRGYDKHTPKHDAVDAAEKPVTQSLNTRVETATDARAAARVRNENQYQADLAAYASALARYDRREASKEDYYTRQRAAYADAMEAWRWQVEDCNRGILKECKKPTPQPADYF